jgi:hypothetical protein
MCIFLKVSKKKAVPDVSVVTVAVVATAACFSGG